ncbi:amino acid ABC transporter permease [Aliagarivorans taiwanensis]|uniref:amino acid ABC transporter permease n=1 Tax=Aliagarivorans taiwanensis TaxID=561966 RepID=UPI00040843E6|nr:amino acid ABC transporter permease [Aliagarivorans taiwanensis]
MDFSLYLEFGPALLKGFTYTVYVCSLGLLLGLAWGLVLYLISLRPGALWRWFYRGYLATFRGTPLLVQVYLLFYGGPFIGLSLSAEFVGVLCLALYVAAYFAEIYRSGFESLAKGQLEAAQDLGMSRITTLVKIQLPQMLALIIPPCLNQTIIMVKESAILSVITVPEMTTAAVRMATQTFTVVEPYLFLALAYWCLNFAIAKVANYCELRATHYLRS